MPHQGGDKYNDQIQDRGGVIGAAVDAGSGAAYDYPMLITVLMEEVGNLVSPAPAAASAPIAQY
jgi:mannitol-specific phosphotransferase system IIBC component